MNTVSNVRGLRLAAGLALLVGACTFDGQELDTYPCSPEYPQCPAGYSCNGTQCVKGGVDDTGTPDMPLDGPLADTTTDGPLSDGPLVDGPLPDGPLPPDGPKPDKGPPDMFVQLDIPQPDMFIPDLPPPDLVPPADGACSPAGATQSCYSGPPGTKGVGLCTTGTQTCASGSWGTCVGEVTPASSDPCDGLDNDCDGTKDDSYACVMGTSGGCTTSCGSWGSRTCSASCTWGSCAPPAEICNGLDDDCDGTKDNSFACAKGTSITCTTSCSSTGSRTCSASCNWLSCVPPSEVCNGLDDDCDGTKDDGFPCVQNTTSSCTTSCGTTGTSTCSATCVAGSCLGPAEVCNGLDDDCDGLKDETFDCVQNTSSSCTTSCGSTGTSTCSSTCKAGSCVPPSEVCNGLDDDCDGLKDETFDCVQNTSSSCTTSCSSTGTSTCSAACKEGTCVPPKEVCNLKDDDCDSVIDNGFTKTAYYADVDGDGQGADNVSAVMACMQPPGHVANQDDCYDNNPDAKKGQTTYFPVQRGDGKFDYNCNGLDEKWSTEQNTLCVWQQLRTNPGYCMGLAYVWKSTPPACGLWGYLLKCVEYPAGSKTCVNQQGAWTQQKCR